MLPSVISCTMYNVLKKLLHILRAGNADNKGKNLVNMSAEVNTLGRLAYC